MYDKALIALIPSGYKDGWLYSVLPANGDGDFNFTRSSTATRVNKDGLIETIPLHTPRLDYPLTNGVVGDCPYLLLEPSRTNTFQRSEEFDNTYWSKTRATITANQITSPDGNVNADYLEQQSGQTNRGAAFVAVTYTASSYSLSVFAKKKEKTFINLSEASTGSIKATWFDLNNGVVGTTNASHTAKIEDFGNGWYRCSIVFTANAGSASTLFYLADTDNSTTVTDSGGVYIWGAQLEEGSYPTSYIKNVDTSAGVTRSADFCNLSGIGAEFNTSEGVLFVESAALADDLTFRQVSLNDSSSNTILVGYRTNSNRIYAQVVSNNVSQAFISYDVADITEFHKIALKYSTNSVHLWIDGVKRASDTSATMPTDLSELDLQGATGSGQFFAKTKQVIYFNEALSDSELQTLTS